MQYTELVTVDQWKAALEDTNKRPAFIFKHSTQCPISAGALDEYMAYLEDEPNKDIQYYYVRVIESRPVSNQIAEDLGVVHKSPQAIFIDHEKALWDGSHWTITYSWLTESIGTP